MAAIDAEIGIRGKYDGIGKCFGHTHQAGIGEAHGHIGVFLQQFQHGFHIVVEVEIHEHSTALKQSTERRSPAPAKKVESLGQDGFASAPGGRVLGCLVYCPRVMGITTAE